jgi:hypothetical protein
MSVFGNSITNHTGFNYGVQLCLNNPSKLFIMNIMTFYFHILCANLILLSHVCRKFNGTLVKQENRPKTNTAAV